MPGTDPTPRQRVSSYSPRFRTALVLTGTGSAGAYHAGVLRAFAEAGVRVDIVAGHGIGAVGALFHAVDGGSHLWDERGAWADPAVARFYRWRASVKALAWAAAAVLATVVVPLVGMAAGSLVYLGAFLLGLAGVTAASGLADRYTAFVHDAFLPGRLTTWVPQAALGLLAVVVGLLLVAARRGRVRGRTREHGAFWWRVFGSPISATTVIAFWREHLWRLLVGGAPISLGQASQLSHRYAELLAENLGQPGFREVIAVVHDMDARHDIALAGLRPPHRQAYFASSGAAAGGDPPRAAETLDLVGVDREHLADVLAAALCLPVATPPWAMTFSPESFWRGETHRLCDRPGALGRVLDEVMAAGADQIIVVSPSAPVVRPHALAAPRVDGFGKLGEWLASQEAAAVREAVSGRRSACRSLHVISPSYNPTGPLDFAGAYDDRSDRVQALREVVARGYEDAYRQFIEPAVGGAEDTAPVVRPTR